MNDIMKKRVIPFITAFVLAFSMFFILATSTSYAAVDEISSCPGQSIERTYYSTFSSFSDVQSSDTSVVIPQLTGSGMIFSDRIYYSGTFTFYLVGSGTAEITLYAGGFNAGTIQVVVGDHEWGDVYTADSYPSCVEEGFESLHCIKCGTSKAGSERAIPKTDHYYDWVIQDATCTEDGLEFRACVLCGTKLEGSDHIIPAYGHEKEDSFVWNYPTCTEEGSMHHHCARCGEQFFEPIPAIGHIATDPIKENEVAATCERDGSYDEVVYCSACNKELNRERRVIPATGHKWNSEYTIDRAPTYTEEGSESIHCTVCNEIKEGSEKPIAKIDPATQTGADGTAVGQGASEEAAEEAITGMTSDNDIPGTVFNVIQLKSTKQTNKSLAISWKKVAGATSYVIYGNKCGKNNKMTELARVTGVTKGFSTIAGKKVVKGTYYKFMVVALDRDNKVISTSKVIHVATKGGKVGNHKKVTTKAKKNKATIKKGKTFKLAAKATPVSKKLKVKSHRGIVYESTNANIAAVSKKGVIKGKSKGTCYIYAYAQNGVFAKIKVTVK